MNFSAAANLYGQFLQLAQSVSTLPPGLTLSPLEAVLLQEVFLRSRDKRPLTVKEAIELKHLASPSTLHRKLIRLRTMALLNFEHHDKDQRTKYLVLTPAALAHFRTLGQAMQKTMTMHTGNC